LQARKARDIYTFDAPQLSVRRLPAVPRADRIESLLSARLTTTRIAVIDDSHRHVGHAGWREQGETHYRVEVVSAAFEGLGRVARQRLVYDLLDGEFANGLHALQLKTLTPAEDQREP
jgi:BolA protein